MRLNNLQKATLLFCKTPAGYQNNVVKAKIAEIWLKIVQDAFLGSQKCKNKEYFITR